jgi:hypothetical protein
MVYSVGRQDVIFEKSKLQFCVHHIHAVNPYSEAAECHNHFTNLFI